MNPIPLFPGPVFTWRVTPDDDGTLYIEAINRSGFAEQDLVHKPASA